MRSKRKELFIELNAGLAISLNVGETKRSRNSRGSEHKPGTRNNRESAIKDHAETTDHDICVNHVQILEKNVNNWHKRIFLESWHSTQGMNTENERKPFPPIYKSSMKPQVEQWFHFNKKPTLRTAYFTLTKVAVAIINSVFKKKFKKHFN